jgi:phosphoribosylanthranilate isomerase
MTWIKICGITNLEDALMAVDAGADALGFVFYEKSPRYVEPRVAREIVARLPARIEKVGVFFKASAEDSRAITMSTGASAIQFNVDVMANGGGSGHFSQFDLASGKPGIKLIPALSMHGNRVAESAIIWAPQTVHAFLLDSGFVGEPGGSGRTFDWAASEAATKAIKKLGRIIVAGGLTASNVGEAMGILKPWGVDVSSGVEAGPGKKDPDKVRAFIAAVRKADVDTQELEIPRRSRSSE